MRVWTLVSLAMLVGCGGPGGDRARPAPRFADAPTDAPVMAIDGGVDAAVVDAPAEPAPASYRGTACAARVAEIKVGFDHANQVLLEVPEPSLFPSASPDGLARVPGAVQVELEQGMRVGRKPYAQVGKRRFDLRKKGWAKEVTKAVRKAHPGGPIVVELWLSAASRTTLTELMGADRLGAPDLEVHLIVLVKESPPPPAIATAPRWARDAAAADPSMLGSSDPWRRAMGDACPALTEVFGDIAKNDVDHKGSLLLLRTPPAILACDCALVDLDAFELFVRTTARPLPTGWLHLRRAPDGPTPPPPSRPAREVFDLVLWLSAQPPDVRAAGTNF